MWFLPTGLKNYNKRQNRFKIDKQECDLNVKHTAEKVIKTNLW